MKKLLLLLLCVPLMFSCGDNSDKEENEDNVKQKRYDIYNEVFLSNDSTYLVDRDENKLSGEIYLTNLHNNKEIYFGNVQNGVPYGKWRMYTVDGKKLIFKGEFKDGSPIGKTYISFGEFESTFDADTSTFDSDTKILHKDYAARIIGTTIHLYYQ